MTTEETRTEDWRTEGWRTRERGTERDNRGRTSPHWECREVETALQVIALMEEEEKNKQKGEEMKTIKNTQKLYFYGYNFDDGEYPTIFRASVSEKGKLRGYFWHSNPDLRYSSFWGEHFISEMENECLGFFLATPGRNDTAEWKRREIVIQDCISRTAFKVLANKKEEK